LTKKCFYEFENVFDSAAFNHHRLGNAASVRQLLHDFTQQQNVNKAMLHELKNMYYFLKVNVFF